MALGGFQKVSGSQLIGSGGAYAIEPHIGAGGVPVLPTGGIEADGAAIIQNFRDLGVTAGGLQGLSGQLAGGVGEKPLHKANLQLTDLQTV